MDCAPKFRQALQVLRSEGAVGDLNDGPDQRYLEENEIENAILELLPPPYNDLGNSNRSSGDYFRHIGREETGQAVIKLWHSGKCITMFTKDWHSNISPIMHSGPLEFTAAKDTTS